ncbi:MAG: cell surface protein SprA [Bergeyella sp.]|nr:cell surface protein SprA [Bergeyella sp.]
MGKDFFYRIALAFVLISGSLSHLVFAQKKTSDSTNVRKDYSLPDPTKYEAFYDVSTGMYYIYPKIGNTITGAPTVMTVEKYQEYIKNIQLQDYYRKKSAANDLLYRKETLEGKKKKPLLAPIFIKNKLFETIFGSKKIELIPQGFASFELGGLYQKIANPLILPQNRKNFAFSVQQRIQLGLLARVGENLNLKANYDTQSGFAFENKMNLVWQSIGSWKDLQSKGLDKLNKAPEGKEDRIIKRVEFGNVNMPLSTGLIRGSQSLFGLKTEFQLGKTKGTVVLSQQQGEAKNIVVQGGGSMQSFHINVADYEDNQHYFLGHYFRNNYDKFLENYPLISSRININRVEVWVLQQGSADLENLKSVLAIRDLGEGSTGYPDNSQNNLYRDITNLGAGIRDPVQSLGLIKGKSFPDADGVPQTYVDGEQFVFVSRARKLSPSEYKLNTELGYISLRQRLNDNQLLAVSFSYTINGELAGGDQVSSKVYKVGEFFEENPLLITKLIKPHNMTNLSSPMWDLMMKNIYSMNANQISSENFMLNIYYRSRQNGKVNYLPNTSLKDQTLLQLFNWDRLNPNNDVQSDGGMSGDGLFDFVSGITIDPENGKLIFTKAQPFGAYLREKLGSNDREFVFEDLYKMQKAQAKRMNLAQRYTLEGRYKSAQSSGISLGAINVPKGSVKVTANGSALVEGQDYVVDYMLGTVKIINEQVKNSGQAINVSLENQMTFNTQRKRFMGLNLERKINDNLLVAATVVNYSERPLTQKVNFGQEALNNTMLGLNLMYNKQSDFLTRLTNKIPFVKTEAESSINFKAEGAYLIPGQNKGINNQVYIDDFDQTTTKLSLKDPAMWHLASKPEKNPKDPIYANAGLIDDVRSGYGRGLLSWYNIDPRFYGVGGKSPNGINIQSVSSHATRRVKMEELFNYRDFVAGEQTFINTFDITYYPQERGPYNYNPNEENTSDRWAGIMRSISVSNFSGSNVEYVEFWMMDPYADGKVLGDRPKLKLHLGNVSEDVLKDGKLQYENGLPTPSQSVPTTTSNWGIQPSRFPILYAFSTQGDDRKAQDVGLDGLNNDEEFKKYGTGFINPVTGNRDPSSDDFVFYMSNSFTGQMAASVTERYKYFRNPDGNNVANSLEVASQTPDTEDVDGDYNLNQTESYNQYTVDLRKGNLRLNSNFIVDEKEVEIRFENGQNGKNKWFLFRIPVSEFDKDVEGSSESILNNVRFARLILDGFDNSSTLRFGSFDLVRSDWWRYPNNIAVDNNDTVMEGSMSVLQDNNLFVGSVNIEENGIGTPPYVLPPGIDRQVLSGNAGVQRQNEASLYMKSINMRREAKGVVKNTRLDMRRYKKLKLFVHAEDLRNRTSGSVDDGTRFFIRLGSDVTDNYYEYEAALQYTPQTASSPMEIWPLENTLDLDIQNFVDAKIKRDKEAARDLQKRFHYINFGDRRKKIFVKGRPSLGNVTTIVLGIRSLSSDTKDIVLWINELRLSGIENKGGYAANAMLDFNLGDFAAVSTNASVSTVGFGGMDQKPAERQQSNTTSFNLNSTVNVEKFLPENLGLKIPLNYSYSQNIQDPKYNPLDSDVEVKKSANRAELNKTVRTYSQQRTIGVINMRKEQVNSEKKVHFYDIENVSVTAIYNDDYYRDMYTERNFRQYLKGNIDYNYGFKPLAIRPFNKMISDTAKLYKYLKWAKEINFNLLPTTFSFRAEIDRTYSEFQYRNIEAFLNGNRARDFDLIRSRNFIFGWQYSLGMNPTKSLRLQISSATRTLNDQLNANSMNTNSIFSNPLKVGRPILYNHRVQIHYRLPFEYLPYTDFVASEIGYGFQYNWNARSTTFRNQGLGNIAQNINNIIGFVTADLPRFFRKFKYFTKIEEVMRKRKQEIDSLGAVHEQNILKKKKIAFKGYRFKNKLKPLQSFAYALTSFKQISINYTENNGTSLPGILVDPGILGMGGNSSPGYGFLMGSQADIRRLAVENGWVSGSNLLTDPYLQNKTRTLNLNFQLMPVRDLRIDINASNRFMSNYSQSGYAVRVGDKNVGLSAFANETISYSKSALLFKTAFRDGELIYQDILANARNISRQLGDPSTLNAEGFTKNYGLNNAYVLIPAFQAALGGKSPGKNYNPRKIGFPIPNWNIIYSGFKNIPLINSQFSKFDLIHKYSSIYTGTGIQSSIDFYNAQSTGVVPSGSVGTLNPYVVNTVGYVEAFAPLIGADMIFRNNFQLRAYYNKNRTYLLGLVNTTLTEDHSREYIIGLGYIIRDFKLKINFKGKSQTVKSDLNIRGDFSIRDTKTTIRNILLNDSKVTGGQTLLGIKVSADYNISQNLNLRLFYDQLMTKYKISTAYPLSTIRAGISATFNFGGLGNN